MAFWKELLEGMKDMNYQRYGADPCLYFKWIAAGLIIWLSWTNNCMVLGPKEEVPKAYQQFNNRFDCNDIGEVKEYVGCKIDIDKGERSMTITQHVLLQSFGYALD
eukprot:8797840-Ditylum_brightwellii.AAC.1